jgi:hypothetical protein
MSDLEFDVAVRRAEPITFKLGGDDHEYKFTPPKSAVMLMPVLAATDGNMGVNMTKSTFDWLGQGLSESDNEHMIARLRDPEDDLDIDTLSTVVEKLSEKVAARPTT